MSRRIVGLAALALSFSLAAAGFEPGIAAATPPPSLRLFVAQSHVRLTHYRASPVLLDVGAYVASVDGAFQLNVQRSDYPNRSRRSRSSRRGAAPRPSLCPTVS